MTLTVLSRSNSVRLGFLGIVFAVTTARFASVSNTNRYRRLGTFSADESVFTGIGIEAKAQFSGLREDNTQKIDFENARLATFSRKFAGEYRLLSEKALKTLIPFSTTYRCESGFPTTVKIKTKARNRLNLEHDVRRPKLNRTSNKLLEISYINHLIN